MNDPTPAPREPVRLAEVERLRELLARAADAVRKEGHRPETEPGGFPGCDGCDLVQAIDAALRQPTYTEPPPTSSSRTSGPPPMPDADLTTPPVPPDAQRTECGFCEGGYRHDPLCRRKGMHTCAPVECPYCHPEGG